MNAFNHSAVLALENIYQKLYRIQAATILLNGITNGDIEELDGNPSPPSFTALASDALSGAISGIFDECDEIQEYLVATTGKSFIDLRSEAIKESESTEVQS
ncbi:MAG: hypothetical protein AB2697_04310 [Candidatus Thiodiazotropha endolucinida]